MEKFKRDFDRYVVIKNVHAQDALTPSEHQELYRIGAKVAAWRKWKGKAPFECVVTERDWPGYDLVWDMIKEPLMADTLQMQVKDWDLIRAMANADEKCHQGLPEYVSSIRGKLHQMEIIKDQVSALRRLLDQNGYERYSVKEAFESLLRDKENYDAGKIKPRPVEPTSKEPMPPMPPMPGSLEAKQTINLFGDLHSLHVDCGDKKAEELPEPVSVKGTAHTNIHYVDVVTETDVKSGFTHRHVMFHFVNPNIPPMKVAELPTAEQMEQLMAPIDNLLSSINKHSFGR